MKAPRAVAVLARGGLGGSTAMATEIALALAADGRRTAFASELPAPRLPGAVGRTPRGVAPRDAIDAAAHPEVLLAPPGPDLRRLLGDLAERWRAEHSPLELVHVHYGGEHLVDALDVASLLEPRPAVVLTLHGSDVEHALATTGAPIPTHTREASAWIAHVPRCDRVLVSTRDLQVRASSAGFSAELCANFLDWSRMSSGCFEETSSIHPRPHRLLFVGHLEPWKGPEDLLETLPNLPGPVEVRFIGTGSLQDALTRRARDLSAGNRAGGVEFLGGRSADAADFAWADVVVVPSRREAFGLVALEALAAERRLVATDVGGLGEWLGDWLREHPEAGDRVTLAPTNDPPALARAIGAMLARLADAPQHPRDQRTAPHDPATRALRERYDRPSGLARHLAAYERALAGRS